MPKKNNIKKPVKRRQLPKKPKAEKHRLKHFLYLAGVYKEPKDVHKVILKGSLILGVFEIFYLYFDLYRRGYDIGSSTMFIGLITPISILIFFILIWLGYYFYLDIKMFQRKVDIEEVLPDFLLLTSSNIRAGLPIDQSLWYAIRPKFGVLSVEIQTVAKEVMSGEDLNDALRRFADKYDSNIVKRTISLLLVGMEAGGEIGELLDKLSLDIQESRITRKEMAANVMTYVIFITVATVAAAPFLFGLASQLLVIVTNLISNMDLGSGTSSMGFSAGGTSLTVGDFNIFAYVMLTITSSVSAMIIAIIQKGSVKGGLKYIPIFVVTSIILFTIASWVFSVVMSGISI